MEGELFMCLQMTLPRSVKRVKAVACSLECLLVLVVVLALVVGAPDRLRSRGRAIGECF